jgi:hypothetical protein
MVTPSRTGTPVPGLVLGWIYMGPEGCVGLEPLPSSPTHPIRGHDSYELWLPEGYRYTVEDNDYEVFGPFSVFGPDGELFADENDVIEAVGEMPTSWGSFCMFGQPLHATEVRFVESRP